MFGHSVRITAIALTLTALGTSSAHGFCHGCRRAAPAPVAAYYRPYVAAYAPAPVVAAYAPAAPCMTCPTACAPAVQQTVSYVPQTCYRTVYVNTPVVAYQPVASCDPCTRCPTTVMRPVTSYVMQAQVVPYTSYRPVVTANYAPCATPCATGCTSGCATAAPVTAAYTPTALTVPAPAPAACCNASYSTPVTSAAPIVSQTAPAISPPPATQQPALPSYPAESTTPPASSTPNQTFQESASPAAVPQSRLMQPQSLNTYPRGSVRALDPELQDRTTAIPQRSLIATPVSTVSNTGWRSAR